MGTKDSNAYNYSNAFDYGQTPSPPAAMTNTPISPPEQQRLRTMPHPKEGT
jgi:hypothetical protein